MKQILLLCSAMVLYAQTPTSFDAVLTQVYEHNWELQALSEDQKVVEATLKQAKSIQNPEFEVALENLGKDEIELMLSQPIELGGKRKQRKVVASQNSLAYTYEVAVKKLELKQEALRRTVPLLLAQQKLSLLDTLIEKSKVECQQLEKRISAGAVKRVDLLRAEIVLGELELGKARIEQEIALASRELALLWGDTTGQIIKIAGTLTSPILPSATVLQKALSTHPSMILLQSEQTQRETAVEVVYAETAPDLAIGAGYKRDNVVGENAFLLSASVELPFFNRNREEKAVAEGDVSKGKIAIEQTLKEKSSEVQRLLQELTLVQAEAQILDSLLLPKALLVTQELNRFYRKGSVSYLEVLESERDYLELLGRALDQKEQRTLLAIDLEELSSYPLEVITTEPRN